MLAGQVPPRASSVVAVVRNGNFYSFFHRLREDRQSAPDEKRSGRPFLISVDLVELVRHRVVENCRFTITEMSNQCPQIS
ncbi:hypothetical protein TNCV_1240521 [Trichonephila clavipes]|uniref:Uncharacterized protein n=1 Tax=Trichonephila clavipes TaxID=2585209 RepID=A0A8X6WFF5_TRICX|nr:hypothetical protein TNCV_1240521 [Trichonephila clavipes]